ncbi:MAG: hypothetical protein JWM57_2613 [Phycisphaerales bacterium]|nr:hypothetical protein [Phycisphaerales bacterium]
MTAPALNLAEAVLAENLAALWAIDPCLARMLEAVSDDETIVLEPTRSGDRTAACRCEDGTSVYLHSRYDPKVEAERQISKIDGETLDISMLGMGLGYPARAALDRAPVATVWVFESRPAVLLAALQTIDFATAIMQRKLRFITELDKGKLFADWTPHLAAATTSRQRYDHAASLRIDPAFYNRAGELIEEFIAYGKTTINTLILNGCRTCENLARNIPWYAAAGGIGRLKNAMAGKPAIIVSAGPSLRKNKHLLKDAAGRAVMISVQTTFQQLIDLGVEPDFVTSLDYHDICTQFFQHIPAHVRTELVAEPKATPKVFDLHPGPLSLVGNDFVERLLFEMKIDKPRLNAGATVAHLAFYLAEHLGCSPIIFVGQDLGFSDGLAYTPGTSYDDLWRPELGRYNTVEMMQWQRIVRDRNILRNVPDFRGKPTYTEERLYTYLQQFERDFANSKSRIIDATEGGVAKAGATHMPLAEALAEFCVSPIDKTMPAHAGADWSRLDEAEACLINRREDAVEIERISRETLPLLKQMMAALDDSAELARLIAGTDALRAEINQCSATYELITQMSQRSELDRFAADRRIEAAGLSGSEKQTCQLRRDLDNVAHIANAAADFQMLMSECIDAIHTTAERKRVAA